MGSGTEVRFIEVRAEGTTMPCMVTAINATQLEDKAEQWLVRRGGWGPEDVALYFVLLTPDESAYAISLAGSPFLHTVNITSQLPTLRVAWQWVAKNWGTVKSGDVIDTQYIQGERKRPKVSDRLYGTDEWEDAYWDREAK